MIVPQGVTGDLPVVVWMHPTAGANDICAPTVPPSNLEGLFLFGASEDSPASEALPGVMYAMAEWYDLDLGALIPEAVHSTIEASMAETCDVLDAAGDVDALEDLFTAELRGGELSDAWACALEANQIARAPLPSSGAPIYWVLGEEDRLAYAPLPRADAESLCDQGEAVDFLECAGLDHEDAAIQTVFLQEAWVAARFEGLPLDGSCVIGPAEACPEP